jgi:hypothetical protein
VISAAIVHGLTWLSAATCLGASVFIWLGIDHHPRTTGRRAGRILVATGHGLLGSRLAYLLATDDLVRLHPYSLIAIVMISLGTAAIWADIREEDRA